MKTSSKILKMRIPLPKKTEKVIPSKKQYNRKKDKYELHRDEKQDY